MNKMADKTMPPFCPAGSLSPPRQRPDWATYDRAAHDDTDPELRQLKLRLQEDDRGADYGTILAKEESADSRHQHDA